MTPENNSAGAIGFLPNLEYDSWVTVGLDGPSSDGQNPTSILPGPWVTEFEAGNSFTVNDGIGSGWYILFCTTLTYANLFRYAINHTK